MQHSLFTDYPSHRPVILHGDCETVLADQPSQSIHLIMTSPPYSAQRTKQYRGVPPDQYVSWFLSKSQQFKRVMTSDGSLVINIKEHVTRGERSTYVLELILALKQQGWRWVEEYCWHKKTTFPGKWPNRFKDAFERCLHFTLNPVFKMNREAVMIPAGQDMYKKYINVPNLSNKRMKPKSGTSFGHTDANFANRTMVYPSNVLHLSPACFFKGGHPAAFPLALPTWFIQLFTNEGDTVLDPFAGSGTTLQAAYNLHRHSIGIDSHQPYIDLMHTLLGIPLS